MPGIQAVTAVEILLVAARGGALPAASVTSEGERVVPGGCIRLRLLQAGVGESRLCGVERIDLRFVLGLGLGLGLGLRLEQFLSVDPGIELGLTVFVTSRRYQLCLSAKKRLTGSHD